MEQHQQGHPALWEHQAPWGHGAPWGRLALPSRVLCHQPWQEGPTAGSAAGSAAGIYRAVCPPRLPATWPQVKSPKHLMLGCCSRYGHSHGVSLCRHPQGNGLHPAARVCFHSPNPPDLPLHNFTSLTPSFSPHPGSKGHSGTRGPVCPQAEGGSKQRALLGATTSRVPKGSTAQRPSSPQTQPRRSQHCNPASSLHPGPEQRAATGPRSSTARLRATRQRHKSQRGHVTVPRASRAMRAGEDCGRSLHREPFVIGDGQAATREGPPVPDNQPGPVHTVRSRSPLPSQPGCSQRGRSGITQQRAASTRVSAPRAAEITSRRQLTADIARMPLPHEPSTTPGPINCCCRRPTPPGPGPAPRRRPGRPAPLLRPRRHVTARSADRAGPAHAHGEK